MNKMNVGGFWDLVLLILSSCQKFFKFSLDSCRYAVYSFQCSEIEHSKTDELEVSVFRPRPSAPSVMFLPHALRQAERRRGMEKVWGALLKAVKFLIEISSKTIY